MQFQLRKSAMHRRLIVSAIACATLCAGTLPAFAQGRVYDRNASNNPEIYQQTHPEDRSNPDLQGRPAPGLERRDQDRRDQDRRDAARNDQQRNAQRQEADRRQGQQRDWDRRAPERRDWDRSGYGRRDYGYVVPQPYYYPAPPVYYPAPPVYFGAVPQPYGYPYGNTAAPVFRAGDFLPPPYLSGQFVISDWDWRGLYAPPAGYQWMLLGADYALVATATGQIVSVVTPQ
jgi:Ni/Co efflux regulator RcnB